MRPSARSGVLALAAALSAGCGIGGGDAGAGRPTWTVARSPLRVVVREGGSLEALKSETISSQVEGQSAIVEVIPEGTVLTQKDVDEGRVLVKLDAKELNEKLVKQQIDVKEARASAENAHSALEIQRHQNASDIRKAELALRFARLDLERYVGESIAERLVSESAKRVRAVGEVPAAARAPDGGEAAPDGVVVPEEGGLPAPSPEDQEHFRGLLAAAGLQGESVQTLREMENAIKLAAEELKRAQNKRDWTKRLRADNYVSREEEEADELAVQRTQVDLERSETAKTQFARYDFPKQVVKLLSDVVEAQDDLARTNARARSAEARTEAEWAAKVGQERLQQDRLKAYEAQLGRCVIRATKPGLVIYASSRENRGYGDNTPIQQGAMVRENQAILSIPDAETLGAVVNIHESAIEKIEKGQSVTVTVDALPDDALHGVVEKKARLPNPTDRWLNPDLKVYATQIRLEGKHPNLQPGMSVRVEIEVASLTDVFTVPLQAISGQAGRPTVYVLLGDRVEERPVVLGLSNDTFVQITSGVGEGDKVLLAPPRAEAGGAKAETGAPAKPEGEGAKPEGATPPSPAGDAAEKPAPPPGGRPRRQRPSGAPSEAPASSGGGAPANGGAPAGK